MSTDRPGSGSGKPPRPDAGRTLPNSIDSERAVLGSVLLDNDVLPEVDRLLKPEDFHHPGHQIIYTRMLDLYHETKPIDLTILAERLKREGELEKVDGYVYLASLEQFVLATSAAIEHAQIVQEKATLRRLMAAADSIMHEASEERRVVQEQIELAEKLIFDVSQRTHSSKFLSLETLMQDTIEEVRHLMESRESSTSLKTHFIDLDQLINGFERTALVILAARPSIGKTAFALNLVRNVAVQGNIPVAFFSLEMGADQLNMRLLCSEARVPSHLVRKGRIKNEEWERLRTTASAMMDVPMWIDDTPGISLMQLRSRARRLKSRVPNLGLIVVDYLQLMTSPQRGREVNRQQEVSEISRGLKGLAKELQVPVLALSQLSRNIEQRSGKEKSARPMLSDLRESGAIEQDADVVMFVHRERVETQRDEDGNPVNKGEPIPTDIIVGKNRNGPIGTVPLLFLPDFTLFVNALQG